MDKRLLDIICCPATRMPLELLDSERLSRLNAAIAAGAIKNNRDDTLSGTLGEALVTRDGRLAYPVRDGIPLLLEDECIDLKQLPRLMKLAPERLATQLAKGLGPLYVLAGDDPLLVDEALEPIRDKARLDGCGEREAHIAERSFDWDGFGIGLQNMSLFATRRLVELRLPTGKPGESGARFLTALAAKPDTGNVIVILTPALDSKTAGSKWATALAQGAVWVELKAPRREQLPAWLRQRLKKAGLDADEESLDVLASRVEGNLLAAKQEIDKLVLLTPDGKVTADAMRESVADGARFDVFQLSDAALAGDVGRTVRVLHGLKREGEAEVLVLWTLVRETLSLADIVVRVHQGRSIDQALNDAGVWRSRQDLFRRAANGRSLKDIGRLVRSAARADQIVKGWRQGQPWNALLEVSLVLSGAQAPLAVTA